MKIQLLSDLHLEFPENRRYIADNPLETTGDVLILAGDIVSDKYRKKAEAFYSLCEKEYDLIISTMGNHEFYNGQINYAYPSYYKKLSGNHVFLNNRTYIHRDVKFIVSTLWSHIPEQYSEYIEALVSDYRLIHKVINCEKVLITTDDINRLHYQSVKFIEKALLDEHTGKVVIVTHHMPLFQCLTPDTKDSMLRFAYASDLSRMIRKYNIDLWIFGHQHESVDFMFYNTRLISNPLGYVDKGINKKYRPDLFIELK